MRLRNTAESRAFIEAQFATMADLEHTLEWVEKEWVLTVDGNAFTASEEHPGFNGTGLAFVPRSG